MGNNQKKETAAPTKKHSYGLDYQGSWSKASSQENSPEFYCLDNKLENPNCGQESYNWNGRSKNQGFGKREEKHQ